MAEGLQQHREGKDMIAGNNYFLVQSVLLQQLLSKNMLMYVKSI